MTEAKAMATMRIRRAKSLSLILPAKAMDLVLSKERLRCDRYAQFFSLIVVQLESDALSDLVVLVDILHERLRLTDERGLLLKGGVGVLLPMTNLQGAKVVLNSIRQIASLQGLVFEAEIFTYTGREKSVHDSEWGDASSDSDSEIEFGIEQNSEDTVVESAGHLSNGTSATKSPVYVEKRVQACDESQVWRSNTGLTHSTSMVTMPHLCRPYPRWKRCMDIICASIGLIVSLPIVLLAAILIKLTSKGPVFFRQMRTGQFGNAFPIYKLRTMVLDAEELKGKLQALNERDGPAFKLKDDPRVTKVGNLLRKTGLDELPQLWNVWVGHMAIVGPRPLPCSEDAECEVWQRRRLDTKPGLTCSWQISKSRKISFEDWMRLDLQYADSRTIFGDVRLMFKTVLAVFLGRVGH